MTPVAHDLSVGAFAAEFGDTALTVEDIPDFDSLWETQGPGVALEVAGCAGFHSMGGEVEKYLTRCIARTLARQPAPAAEIDRLVLATSDAALRRLDEGFVLRVLEASGLTGCVPVVLSLQQCAASISALAHAHRLFDDDGVDEVLVVSFEVTPDERARVRPFALFGDGVASCIVSRRHPLELRLRSTAIDVDFSGLRGEDGFASRQKVAAGLISSVLGPAEIDIGGVEKVLGTNLYSPLAVFGAAAVGIRRDRLHIATLPRDGHCGNADWMINLIDVRDTEGLTSGAFYLAQSSAPGFFAGALLEAL